MAEEFKITIVGKKNIEVTLYNKIYLMNKGYLRWALGEVRRWQGGATNFTCKLMELIAKADCENKKKIAKAFPEEVFAYLMWYHNESDEKYENKVKFMEKTFELLEEVE